MFFTRPDDSVIYTALKDESTLVATAVENAPAGLREIFDAGHTSREWFVRRVASMRANNQKVCMG